MKIQNIEVFQVQAGARGQAGAAQRPGSESHCDDVWPASARRHCARRARLTTECCAETLTPALIGKDPMDHAVAAEHGCLHTRRSGPRVR